MLTDEIIKSIESLPKYLDLPANYQSMYDWSRYVESVKNTWLSILRKIKLLPNEKILEKICLGIEKIINLFIFPDKSLYGNYYFLTASLRYQINYSQLKVTSENIQKFIESLEENLQEIYKAIVDRRFNNGQARIIAINSHYTVYHDANNPGYQYFLVSPLLLAEPTNRSYVKVVFPLIIGVGRMLVKLSDPFVLKVEIYQDKFYPGFQEHELLYGYTTIFHYNIPRLDTIKRRAILKLFPGMNFEKFIKNYIKEPSFHFVWQDLIDIFIAITAALQTIHTQGFLHLDIKPANIILNNSLHNLFSAYIIDADNIHRIGELPKQTSIGTREYRAPELQTKFSGAIQANLDVYSLGKIFCKCIEGMIQKSDKDNPRLNSVMVDRLKRLIDRMVTEDCYSRICLDSVLNELRKLKEQLVKNWPLQKLTELPTSLMDFPLLPDINFTISTAKLSGSQYAILPLVFINSSQSFLLRVNKPPSSSPSSIHEDGRSVFSLNFSSSASPLSQSISPGQPVSQSSSVTRASDENQPLLRSTKTTGCCIIL